MSVQRWLISRCSKFGADVIRWWSARYPGGRTFPMTWRWSGVGRGTSTYDGMALARAIVEFLAVDPQHGCRVIFSTHYHELAALEDAFPSVQSHRSEVVESADRVTFTYRVVRGRTDRSYGVHV